MDPDKKPNSSSNEPTDSTDVDEAQAAAILSAAANKPSAPSETSASPAPSMSSASASAGGEPTPAEIAAGTGSSSLPSSGMPSAAPAAPVSPTAPAPGTTPAPLPDAPTPNMGDSSSVLGAAPGGIIAPKKGKKPMIIAGIIVVLLVVILGGVAAAYYQVMNKPQNVLDKALLNSFDAGKTASMNFEGAVDIKPKGSDTISTTFTGGTDAKTGAFKLNAKVDATVTTVNVDVLSADGSTLYLRVSGLDGVASLLGLDSTSAADDPLGLESVIAPLISSLNNQWIEVNSSMLKQLTGTDTSVTTKLSDSDRQKLGDAYKKNKFIVVSKTLKDETIKDKSSKHYQVTVDKDRLKGFVTAVKAANISSLKITSDDLDAFNKSADKYDFSKYPVDVWIAKDSKMIDQISFSASSNGTSASVRVTVDDYNKSVKVTAPANAKSLLDIISNLLSGTGGTEDLDSLTSDNGISL
jgi:uncharacterized protein YpmB